ncbi:MAG: hypothetical protein KME35_20145 [Aphanocapsa sp. GSE-SYN-MK-11-07L]|jgi:hypothetical protein|nr:hypothetical protein [Aphanocapsa sp. GSE-SYN-MK-11-07L]
MGINIAVYAEKFNGNEWFAEPTQLYVEELFDHQTGESWLEPQAIYYDRNDQLSEILGMRQPFNDLTQIVSQARGFPEDISGELIDHFARTWLQDWWKEPQDWLLLRQQARNLNFDQTWFLLSELLSFDWYGQQQQHYGEVKAEDASRFGDGQQHFPADLTGGVWKNQSFRPTGQPQPGYAQVSWIETYAEKVGSRFMNQVLPLLQTYGTPNNVRIVLWLEV